MQKLSVEEYAKLINVSPKTVYRRIDRGQVITCKDTVNNKEVIRVIVDNQEILHNDMSESSQRQMTSSVMSGGQNNDMTGFLSSVANPNDQYLEFIKKMYEDNRNLAELAGQTKLLTDSEARTKEQYFQLVQEKAELKAKLELSQQRLKEMEEKLKQKEVKKTVSLKQKLKDWASSL